MPVKKAVTCPVCGCLCDDLEVTVKSNRITKTKKSCGLSESKFMNYNQHRLLTPLIRRDCQLAKATYEEAIQKTAEILADAKYPLLYGWSSTSCEAIRIGLELAETVGGIIDNTSTICHGPSELGMQDVGISTCTLGQVRHRADLVIYWGSNPWSAHPRHIERYTNFSEGRFERSEWKSYFGKTKAQAVRKKVTSAVRRLLPDQTQTNTPAKMNEPERFLSKTGRKLIVVDVRKTRTAEIADYFVQIQPNSDYELLQTLRSLVKEEDVEVEEVAGVPLSYLEEIADAMLNCEFGVLFFGLGLTMSSGKLRNVDSALSLVRDLNARTKFTIMPMRGHFNVTGADTVFTWQTGYPYAVDFSLGYPRYNPGETSAVDVLLRQETDAALVVASDPVASFPQEAVKHLVRKPLIVIDPHMNCTSQLADIVFPSAFVGIEAEGTAYRMDHVPLPLKKIVTPPAHILSDEETLTRILNEVLGKKASQLQEID